MGHFFAAKQKNLAVDPPVFTPIGAFIAMKELPASARDEAYMAFGGPLLGTIGAIVALVLGMVLGVPVLVQVSMYAFWLNLFNLIPLAPLDGGRISMAIDRRMWVIGAAVFAYFMFSFGMNGFNLLIGLFIGMQAYQDIQMRKNMAAVQPSYFDVGFNTRLGYAIAYLALGCSCCRWSHTRSGCRACWRAWVCNPGRFSEQPIAVLTRKEVRPCRFCSHSCSSRSS